MKKLTKEVDYDRYIFIQRHRSQKKFGKRFEWKMQFRQDFAYEWNWASGLMPTPQVIGCMGAKRNAEYEEFCRHLPKAEVYGVDIVPEVVNTGKNCFCLDFNHLPEDWKEKFDLVYSNSLDHSFDVEVTIKEWTRVTKKGGYIMISFSTSDKLDESDRYSFSLSDIDGLFPKDKYQIIGINEYSENLSFICIFKKL